MSFRMFKYFYVIFCLGLLALFVMSLGQYAAVAFKDGWWVFTKDVASIVGSLAFPWAVWLYFKQRKIDHDERKVKQLLELMEELTAVLVPEKLLANQVVIGSLLHRINSKRMEVDEINRNEFDFALRTHVNQLLKNIEPKHLIASYSELGIEFLGTEVRIEELSSKYEESVVYIAKLIINSCSYEIHRFGSEKIIDLTKGFAPGLLSQLVLLAQPICKGNFTVGEKGGAWKEDKLKDIFTILPMTIASYIYLADSIDGKRMIIDIDSET